MKEAELLSEIERLFESMTPRMQKAARFVVKNPIFVALYPLRQVAQEAEVSPTTLVRLALSLNFSGYASFRDALRTCMKGADSYASDAFTRITNYEVSGFDSTHLEGVQAQLSGLTTFFNAETMRNISAAGDLLFQAETIYVFGLRSMYTLSFYFDYLVSTFNKRVALIEDGHGMLADRIHPIGPKDAMLSFSFEPYARVTVDVVHFARGRGARLVSVTDSPLSPLAKLAEVVITPPTNGPSFYQSLAASVMVVEALAAQMMNCSGVEAIERIRDRFQARAAFGDYWAGVSSGTK